MDWFLLCYLLGGLTWLLATQPIKGVALAKWPQTRRDFPMVNAANRPRLAALPDAVGWWQRLAACGAAYLRSQGLVLLWPLRWRARLVAPATLSEGLRLSPTHGPSLVLTAD
jgi:hypothetical protein